MVHQENMSVRHGNQNNLKEDVGDSQNQNKELPPGESSISSSVKDNGNAKDNVEDHLKLNANEHNCVSMNPLMQEKELVQTNIATNFDLKKKTNSKDDIQGSTQHNIKTTAGTSNNYPKVPKNFEKICLQYPKKSSDQTTYSE